MNYSAIGTSWDDFEKNTFTPKEIAESKYRAKAILDERSAINFAKNEAKSERDDELAEKWRKKGYTESQIKELLS